MEGGGGSGGEWGGVGGRMCVSRPNTPSPHTASPPPPHPHPPTFIGLQPSSPPPLPPPPPRPPTFIARTLLPNPTADPKAVSCTQVEKVDTFAVIVTLSQNQFLPIDPGPRVALPDFLGFYSLTGLAWFPGLTALPGLAGLPDLPVFIGFLTILIFLVCLVFVVFLAFLIFLFCLVFLVSLVFLILPIFLVSLPAKFTDYRLCRRPLRKSILRALEVWRLGESQCQQKLLGPSGPPDGFYKKLSLSARPLAASHRC